METQLISRLPETTQSATRSADSQTRSAAPFTGIRLRGSRLSLTATYRLAADVPLQERETFIGMAAILSSQGSSFDDGIPGDFEPAARNCLAALYMRILLGKPTLVAWPFHRTPSQTRGDAGQVTTHALRLKLEQVRAVSANFVEYCLKPKLFVAPRAGSTPNESPHRDRRLFSLVDRRFDRSTDFALWVMAQGMEGEIDRLTPSDLPKTRSGLLGEIDHHSKDALRPLQEGLLGLDESRFAKDLRIAFMMLVAPAPAGHRQKPSHVFTR